MLPLLRRLFSGRSRESFAAVGWAHVALTGEEGVHGLISLMHGDETRRDACLSRAGRWLLFVERQMVRRSDKQKSLAGSKKGWAPKYGSYVAVVDSAIKLGGSSQEP